MPNPYRQALEALDTQPAQENPYRQALAVLDVPGEGPTPPKAPLPWASGVVGRNARAGVFTGVNMLSGIPAALELGVRNLVGADMPSREGSWISPLAGHLNRQDALQREAQAADTYEETLPQKIVGGGVQTMSNPLNALLPVAAGTQAAMRVVAPMTQQATTAQALNAATNAAGVTAGTQAAVDSASDGRLGLNEALNAIVQGIIETKMGRAGGQIGELRRLPGTPTGDLTQRAVDTAADTVVRNPVQEGATGLAQETAGKVLLEGRLPTGTEATEATAISAGAGAMQSGAANVPALAAETVAAGLDRRASGNEAIARAMAQAFDPDAAGMQVPVAAMPGGAEAGAAPQVDGPGPVEISPEVAAAAKANPALLDLLTPDQIAAALENDRQQAVDADPASLEATAAGDSVAQALDEADAAVLEQRQLEQPPAPQPVDLEAESARRTLADQDRVQNENRERERRRLAFALREDLGMVGKQLGGHGYDAAGTLTYDEKAPNRASRMGEERARAFIREVLGDDDGALAGDDPTASPAVVENRMQQPVPGAKSSSPAPEPTAADIIALPPAQRMGAFRVLSPETRQRLQPEITRLMQQQRDEAAWAKQGLKPPKPGAARAVPLPTPEAVDVPGQPGRRAKPAADALPTAQPAPAASGIPPVSDRVEGQGRGQPAAPVNPSQPAVPPAAQKPPAVAPSQPGTATAPAAPPANKKEISRLARVSKAVLPSSVKVDEAEDHIRITYPGGASVQVRPVDTVPLDPAAWFDSVGKVKGALSAAFSRAGFGATAPTKAQWMKLPKNRQQAVMAELPPVAAVTDISGKRVGISREALVRLVQPGKRTDAQLADAIEEEDHHVVFSALLTDEERTTIRDELARSRPELAKEDPASRAVMEAAYEHFRTWNQDRQRAAVTPKAGSIFGKVMARVRALLKWFSRTPTVTGKTAASVWENLGAVRERTEVTPAASEEAAAEGDDANAVLIPRDDSLEGDDLQRQWRKANGERKPKGETFQQLEERSAKVDYARKLQGRSPDDVLTTEGDVPYRNGNVDFGDPRVVQITKEKDWERGLVPDTILDTNDEEAMWRIAARAQKALQRKTGIAYAVPQALNQVLPPEQRQTFEQWQEEAQAILDSPTRLADMRARAQAGEGLSAAEQVALRRLVSEQLSEAAQSGNANRWQEALETASLRKASGARVARELAARRLDLSTPEGRREMVLSYVAEMGSRWQNAYNRATTKRDRAAAVDRWSRQQERIHTVLKKRFGIDLADPRLGDIFTDAYSLGRLMDAASDAAGQRFSLGNLVGYYTAGNLLTAASFAVNLTGYPMMGAIAGFKGVTQMAAKHLMGMKGNRELTSMQGAWAAARAGTAAIGRGMANGALAFWTGRPEAEKQARPIEDDANDHTRSTSPIKNPFLRAATAPFLEANRFVDEMFWTIGYNGALAAAAAEARLAGDTRSHREMIDSPDADMVERASEFADWLTLRSSGKEGKLSRGISALRSPTALEDIVDKVVPGAGRFTVNPLYFTMPFFNAIAKLTVEGAKLSPYGLITNVALAAKRGVDAKRADVPVEGDKLTAKAINNLAYALAGAALAALALVPGEDDDDLVKGSPSNYKSAGERSIREAIEKPRTIGGVDYSRFDPGALPLALHADFRDAMRDLGDGKDGWETFKKLGGKAFNATIERQFLSGVSDLFKPRYDENGDPKTVPDKFGENVVGMVAPGRQWIGSARRLTETEKMQRPRDALERPYDAGRPYRNQFGETEQLREEGAGSAAAGLFFTPRGEASDEAQQWQRRIHDLNEAIEESGGKPWWPNNPGRSYQEAGRTVKWTDDQYDRLREISGRKWLAMLRGASALRNENLPPETQLKIVQAVREQANQYAAAQVRAK
jgi:hypothetical protein